MLAEAGAARLREERSPVVGEPSADVFAADDKMVGAGVADEGVGVCAEREGCCVAGVRGCVGDDGACICAIAGAGTGEDAGGGRTGVAAGERAAACGGTGTALEMSNKNISIIEDAKRKL